MAQFQQTYKEDGSYEERLTFAGKEFVFRRTPFIRGIAKGLDKDIVDQVEAVFSDISGLDRILDQINDLVTGFADGQDTMVWLTDKEKELNRDV